MSYLVIKLLKRKFDLIRRLRDFRIGRITFEKLELYFFYFYEVLNSRDVWNVV